MGAICVMFPHNKSDRILTLYTTSSHKEFLEILQNAGKIDTATQKF